MLARLVIGLSLVCTPAVLSAAVRAELPIREVDLSDGARRYVVQMEIAGRHVEAGLDTGSTGLRVLPRALASDALSQRGETVRYFYTSGTRFEGHAIRQGVSLGGISGDVKLMRIDRLGCTLERSRCPAAHIEPASFGIQGDGLPGQGFDAILGIGMKPDAIANPLEQLGVKRWIVDLPMPSSKGRGMLILNPTDAELAGYKRLRILGEGNQLSGCLAGASGSICGLTVFDTGAPGIRIVTNRRVAPWPQGTPAEIRVADRTSEIAMPIEIGRRDQATALFMVVRGDAEPARLSFGIAPYFRWSVLYDLSAREIGVRER